MIFFVHIGNKIISYTDCEFPTVIENNNKISQNLNTNKQLLRINLRYNNLSESLEFLLVDLTPIVELQEIKISNKYKKLFLNKFSHEFKNPLLNIIELSKNLRKESSNFTTNSSKNLECNTYNKDLDHINNLCKLMTSLIGDFDFITESSIPDEEYLIEKNRINFSKFLINLIKKFENLIELNGKKLKIRYVIDKNINGFIYSDARRLKQILLNLLSNSYKFTLGGEICIRAKLNNSNIDISVSDTGVGMNQDLIDKLMKNSNLDLEGIKMHSIGLGLFIVKKIVSLLGCNFTITSKIGVGTTVSFSIPQLNKDSIIEFQDSYKRKNSHVIN